MISGVSASQIPKVLETEFLAKVLPNVPLVPMNESTKKKQLPYVTYAVIAPYLKHAWNNRGGAEPVSMEVQLTVHGHHQNETMDQAFLLRSSFENELLRDNANKLGVYIEEIVDVYARPVEKSGVGYEYTCGIDVRLAYIPIQQLPEFDPIDTVELPKEKED